MRGRHPVAEANEKSPFGSLTAEEFYEKHAVSHSSETFLNPRGLNIFTQSWIPQSTSPVIGIVAIVHGYTGESSWMVQLTAIHIAKSGFAVCAIDHQGHGYSDGLVAHIPDINPVVDDCIDFFDRFRSRYPSDLPSFLYAESLGGAIALLIHLRGEPKPWQGIVLNGAMCGISPRFKPPWPLEHFLWVVATLLPTWRIIPTKSIPGSSFKVEWKRNLAIASPKRPVQRPRAATAYELMRVCRELQEKFEQITLPMLIVHGEEDVVCDPACVKDLYLRAGSKDKSLKIYPGMWHQLVGEPDENVDIVFNDVIDWLCSRANAMVAASASSS